MNNERFRFFERAPRLRHVALEDYSEELRKAGNRKVKRADLDWVRANKKEAIKMLKFTEGVYYVFPGNEEQNTHATFMVFGEGSLADFQDPNMGIFLKTNTRVILGHVRDKVRLKFAQKKKDSVR